MQGLSRFPGLDLHRWPDDVAVRLNCRQETLTSLTRRHDLTVTSRSEVVTSDYCIMWSLLSAGTSATHLGDLRVGAAAVSRRGVHPARPLGHLKGQVGVPSPGALLPERALPVLDTPATFKPGVGFQAHATAVPQRAALIQVCWRQTGRWRETGTTCL